MALPHSWSRRDGHDAPNGRQGVTCTTGGTSRDGREERLRRPHLDRWDTRGLHEPLDWGYPRTIGFRIERADVTDLNTGAVGPYALTGNALANQITFTDSVVDPAMAYSYRVVAYNAAVIPRLCPCG